MRKEKIAMDVILSEDQLASDACRFLADGEMSHSLFQYLKNDFQSFFMVQKIAIDYDESESSYFLGVVLARDKYLTRNQKGDHQWLSYLGKHESKLSMRREMNRNFLKSCDLCGHQYKINSSNACPSCSFNGSGFVRKIIPIDHEMTCSPNQTRRMYINIMLSFSDHRIGPVSKKILSTYISLAEEGKTPTMIRRKARKIYGKERIHYFKDKMLDIACL